MSAAAEAKAAAVPESVLRKLKREEQWAADKKEKALADRKKALESRKIIFARAKQYAQEYDAQVSSDPPPPALLLLLGSLRLVMKCTFLTLVVG
jgi:hypothetical protein